MRSVILLVSLLMTIVPAGAQPSQPRKFFLIDDDSAFIDINGQVVISGSDPNLVDEVKRVSKGSETFRQSENQRPGIRFSDFSEGRAVIGWALCPMCRNPFWVNAFIDETGRLVIPPFTSYTRFGEFHEGLARYFGGRWGFINPDGQIVIAAKFYEARDFSEERAVVRTSDTGLFGYSDRVGKLVIPERFYWASDFHDGLAAVQIMKGFYGYIDNYGKIMFSRKSWLQVSDFSNGRAAVEVEVANDKVYRGYKERKWGFIDQTGKFAIPPQFDRVGSFAQGRARFSSPGGYGFIISNGDVHIKPQFADAKDFSEGLAAVAVLAGKDKKLWGYIAHDGQWAIRPQFENAQSFSGGLAAVNCDEYGRRCQAYIDRQGIVRWQKS